jgi:hypothetical protein
VKTDHGKRTERGCEVTVDGQPLRACSNLSGNAIDTSLSAGAGAGELLVESSTVLVPNSLKLEDATANAAMVSEGGHLDVPTAVSNDIRDEATRTAVQAVGAAQRASDAAVVAQTAREDDRASDTPADEAMSTTNREADHHAYSAHRAADRAMTVARDAENEAKRCGGGNPPSEMQK